VNAVINGVNEHVLVLLDGWMDGCVYVCVATDRLTGFAHMHMTETLKLIYALRLHEAMSGQLSACQPRGHTEAARFFFIQRTQEATRKWCRSGYSLLVPYKWNHVAL